MALVQQFGYHRSKRSISASRNNGGAMGLNSNENGSAQERPDERKTKAVSAQSIRLLVSAGWVVLATMLAISIWWHWPYLAREHRRLEPWRIALTWFGEFVALFWFVWFGLSYCVLGRSSSHGAVGDRDFRWFAITMWVGIAGELIAQGSLVWQEQATFAKGRIVWGEVIGFRTIPSNGGWDFLHTTFQDANGDDHVADFQIHRRQLPPVLTQALRAGQLPAPVQVTYDPEWPDRNWLTAVGWDDENRLYFMLLLLSFLQGTWLAALITGRAAWARFMPDIPLYKTFPLVVDTVMLFLVAVAMLLAGDSW
jgi:hypothetical protein